MLTERTDTVIGVDTHRDRHALAFVQAGSGALSCEAQIEASRSGYRRALQLAEREAGGERLWAIEGSSSYGAGLARFLAARGERIVEVTRSRASGEGGRGKSDPLDALRAARAALAGEASGQPRASGKREALRVLLLTREAAVATRRSGLNQLRALVLCAPEELRERLQGLPRQALLNACLRLRPQPASGPQRQATSLALRSCARRVDAATREAAELERELRRLVGELGPQLLAEPGLGPICAAQILVSWSHRGRLRSEAAFARLAGTAPIPASSGQVVRHRLDRRGDRRLNRALHQVVISRRKHHAETIAYSERRLREGKSVREVIRCLKRYLARSLFRLLEQMPEAA